MGCCTATQLTKLAGTDSKLSFECLAERGMGIVSGRQSNLSDVHGSHAELAPGAFHAQPADVGDGTLADMRAEHAMEVGMENPATAASVSRSSGSLM